MLNRQEFTIECRQLPEEAIFEVSGPISRLGVVYGYIYHGIRFSHPIDRPPEYPYFNPQHCYVPLLKPSTHKLIWKSDVDGAIYSRKIVGLPENLLPAGSW
jgi:hypothetical protein